MNINLPLMALSIGAFGIGITEFSPMGMLPIIADDLGVSIPTAGLLISAYAFGVLISAPVMTLSFSHMPRRRLLLISMAIFTLGNIISAVASNYTTLLIGRMITSLNHATFFGVGAVVATNIVPPNKKAGAVAAMFSGLTLATIGGVPLASFVGATIGWRWVFACIAVIGVMTMFALRFSLPVLKNDTQTNMHHEFSVLTRGAVLAALLLTVVGASSMFTVFTYIVPILQQETRASTDFVTAVLVIYGTGLAVGNVLGGRFADTSLYGTLIVSLTATMLLLVIFALMMHSAWLSTVIIFLWGMSSFAIVPPLQSLVVHEAKEAPNLASSMNIGAFNLGNALGAAFGGTVISAHLGLPAVSVAGAITALLGLMMTIFIRHTYSI